MGTLGLLLTLVVRLYDATALTGNDRAVAISAATAILVDSNIGTTWLDCQNAQLTPALPSPQLSGPACDRPIETGEVAIRLVRGTTPLQTRGQLPLGYSLVDTKARSGALATIYLDRVEWLANASGVDARVLLGRTIAHEIGHLLLGTNAHGRRGLMRAVWSQASLRRQLPDDWTFASRDAVEMRRALLRQRPVANTAQSVTVTK